MNFIEKNVSQFLAKNFDIFFIDVYGVLWNGKEIISFVPDTLKYLMECGKKIIIVSNATIRVEDAIKSFNKKGLVQGIHYDEFVTSGEVAHDFLMKKELSFKANPSPKKYFTFGTQNQKLFKDTEYTEVFDPKEADFIYISSPQLTESEYKIYSAKYADSLFESTWPNSTEPRKWDSLIVDPFLEKLHELSKLNLPALNANPDFTAAETAKDGTTHFFVRQGSIASAYIEMDKEVVQIGKPFLRIFKYCIDLLKTNYSMSESFLNSSKIAMIGDTIDTDIFGAKIASKELQISVEGVLTLTGVYGNKLGEIKYSPKTVLADYLKHSLAKECVVPDYVIRSFGEEIVK